MEETCSHGRLNCEAGASMFLALRNNGGFPADGAKPSSRAVGGMASSSTAAVDGAHHRAMRPNKPSRLTISTVADQRAPRIMLVRYCDYVRMHGLEPAPTSPDEVVFDTEALYGVTSYCSRLDGC